MKIGITGSYGILGTLLCHQLDRARISYSRFEGDVRSKTDIEKWVSGNNWDGVIHLAAIVSTKQVKEDPLTAYDVNVSGTINLLEGLKKAWQGQKKWFFYASSSHVYKSSNKAIQETDTLDPVSLYGKTKLMAENIIQEAGSVADYPFNVCIGRIFSFFHKTQKPPFLYPNILKRLKEEDLSKNFFLYEADSIRDFLNAEEVAEIIIKLAQKQSIGTFNIASGKPTKIRDFVQSLSPVHLKITTNDKKDFLLADTTKLNQELKGNGNDK